MSARTARAFGATLAALALIAAAPTESRLEQHVRLRGEAGEAAKAGDLAKAETALEAALALYPTSPGSLIRLARVEAAAGKPVEAVAHVAAYADLGLTLNPSLDPALKTLVGRDDFGPVATKLKANAEPVGAPRERFDLAPGGDVIEGLARVEGGWVFSSVAGHRLTWISQDGNPRTVLLPEADPSGLFGMAYDAKRKVLWVAEARGPGVPGSTGAPRTGVIKVSWPRGDVLARYVVPDDGKKHQLGDVALGEDGSVYASDSAGAVIYRLKPGAKTLEPFVTSRDMASPQGMVICPQADAMIVADYSTGLHRIDLRTGAESAPIGPHRIALAGTDGLFRVPYRFPTRTASADSVAVIAIQNGVSPQRVLLLRLSPDCRDLESASVLAAGGPLMDDLTLGAPAPEGIVVIGSSGWSGYDGDGKPVAGQPTFAKLISIPLP